MQCVPSSFYLYAISYNYAADKHQFTLPALLVYQQVHRPPKHLQHEAQERLQTMVSHFTIDPSRIKQHVRFGSVRDEVNELAEELGADVVVIGSRNPSISTHLLGSNASSVIRHANLPVLVVR